MELPAPQPTGEGPNSELRIPASLDAALAALEADGDLVDAIGPELVEAFTILKRAEWDRYCAAVDDPSTTDVTRWELDYYLPFH